MLVLYVETCARRSHCCPTIVFPATLRSESCGFVSSSSQKTSWKRTIESVLDIFLAVIHGISQSCVLEKGLLLQLRKETLGPKELSYCNITRTVWRPCLLPAVDQWRLCHLSPPPSITPSPSHVTANCESWRAIGSRLPGPWTPWWIWEYTRDYFCLPISNNGTSTKPNQCSTPCSYQRMILALEVECSASTHYQMVFFLHWCLW